MVSLHKQVSNSQSNNSLNSIRANRPTTSRPSSLRKPAPRRVSRTTVDETPLTITNRKFISIFSYLSNIVIKLFLYTEQPPTTCDRCVKRCCSHRVIWFCLLLPIYIILLVVTALVSTTATKTEDGVTKSFADIFFGIVYFFLLTSALCLLLRYVCHKCDKRSVCTCPRDSVYSQYDGQLLYHPKKTLAISDSTRERALCIPPNPLLRQNQSEAYVVDVDGDHYSREQAAVHFNSEVRYL